MLIFNVRLYSTRFAIWFSEQDLVRFIVFLVIAFEPPSRFMSF